PMISGIRRDTDDTQADGAILAINLRFVVEGEYRRRLGLEIFDDIGSLSSYQYRHPQSGQFALLVTSTGTLEAISV
ncbi:hypothetical protein, partial [Streptococcus pseudopneumoniae]|uniref:hypothetical protein n=1 Tax=Streptococcus pseudopneumoniae TaxID=257758 RepID=UPI0019D6646C